MGQPTWGRSGRWVESSPFSFPAGGSVGLLRGAGLGTGALVVPGGAKPSTEALGAPRLTPTAGAKVAKASRRPHMAGSKARTLGARDGGRWVRLFLPGLGSPPPLPAAAARPLRPPARPQPASWPRTREPRGGERRGRGRGLEGEEGRGGLGGQPQVSAPIHPAPPLPPLPPPHSSASLRPGPLPSVKPPAPWIPRNPVRLRPTVGTYCIPCTLPGGLPAVPQVSFILQIGKLRLGAAN